MKKLVGHSLCLLALFLCISEKGQADGAVTLPQLSQGNIAPLFRVLAADLAFRPVTPASSLGKLWGFSFGVTANQASTSSISNLVGSGVPQLYDGNLSAIIQAPLGLALEVGAVPQFTVSGTSINRIGADIRWTITDVFGNSPFSAALRGLYTNANLSQSQNINGSPVNVSYGTSMVAGLFTLSKDLMIVEPFVSYGVIQHTSTLTGTGTGSLYDSSFSSGTTSTSLTAASGWLQAGVELKLVFVTLAAEYDNIFSTDSFAARFAFKF